jgi:hypothetical protein
MYNEAGALFNGFGGIRPRIGGHEVDIERRDLSNLYPSVHMSLA